MCKAITKKGDPCKNPPMKGSEYCYAHRSQHIETIETIEDIPIPCIPWWKNTTIYYIVPIILAIIISLITVLVGPLRSNQEEIIQEEIINDTNTIIDDSNTIKGLLYDLKSIETIEYDNLIKKYPSGFLLFAADYSGLVTPPGSNTLDNYELNWSDVKIVFLEDNAISFLLPYITYEPADKSACISYDNILIQMPRGAPGSIYSFPLPETVVPDNIFIEIISYTNDGIIMCLGFRDKSLKTQQANRPRTAQFIGSTLRGIVDKLNCYM